MKHSRFAKRSGPLLHAYKLRRYDLPCITHQPILHHCVPRHRVYSRKQGQQNSSMAFDQHLPGTWRGGYGRPAMPGQRPERYNEGIQQGGCGCRARKEQRRSGKKNDPGGGFKWARTYCKNAGVLRVGIGNALTLKIWRLPSCSIK